MNSVQVLKNSKKKQCSHVIYVTFVAHWNQTEYISFTVFGYHLLPASMNVSECAKDSN